MKNQLFNKRIPTIFAIGVIVLGIVLTTIIVRIQTNLRSSAGSSEEPKNVEITNLSDDTFTITYQTDADTVGSINYGSSKQLGNTQLEDLPKNVHSLTVEKLSPDTKYYLAVISGQNTFLNNGTPFEILTGPKLTSSPSASVVVIKGKIILPDGNAPNEALVYLDANNSQLLSTTVAKDGEFNFSSSKLRTNDLSSYLEINKDSILKLFAIGNALKSTVLLSGSETYLVPTITLSNDYDFTKDFVEIASKSAFPSFPITTESENLKPQILTPKKEQAFTDQKPQFQGTSLPNETVDIIIHSDENIQTQVVADSNGNWTYRPPANLSPGAHTITIKTHDSEGILTTLMQSFTVFAQGSQVSESATPSATPTQSITPTSIPTPTPTTILTPTPTPTPFQTPTSLESKGGLPPTGSSSIVLIIGGIVTTISGIALFLLTRTIL